jgi:hypothetical protein
VTTSATFAPTRCASKNSNNNGLCPDVRHGCLGLWQGPSADGARVRRYDPARMGWNGQHFRPGQRACLKNVEAGFRPAGEGGIRPPVPGRPAAGSRVTGSQDGCRHEVKGIFRQAPKSAIMPLTHNGLLPASPSQTGNLGLWTILTFFTCFWRFERPDSPFSRPARRSGRTARRSGRTARRSGRTARRSGRTARRSGRTARRSGRTARRSGRTARRSGWTARRVHTR